MGTLVFQATLGGAINLIGPNTASTVNFTLPSADGSSGQAVSTNGSGVLSFGTLAVTAGGTGVTTSTGSGNNVLSTSPTLVTPILGTPTSGNFSTGTFTWPTFNQNTSGTAAGLSATLAVASGGTGLTSTPANGALDIGNGTGFTRTTLTAGSGVTITNASGAITIAASGGGASAATPTALGTVYGKTDTSSLAFLGYQAGNSNTGTNNVFVGYQAGYTNSSGQYSVMVGQGAGYSIASNTITCVGALAGYSTTGNQNHFFGNVAGYDVTTGSNNTILGGYTGNADGLDIRTASNYAVIADGVGNRLLSTANGQTLALDGGAVPNSGTGITFPATQSASSDANTLDDYEEGTWTTTPTSGSGSFTTVAFNNGVYTKVGNVVTCSGKIEITTAGTAAGSINLTLPFGASATAYSGSASEFNQVGFVCFAFPDSTSVMAVKKYDNTTAIGSGHKIVVSVTYRVA